MHFMKTTEAVHFVDSFHIDRGGVYLPAFCGETLERKEAAVNQHLSPPICQNCNQAYWTKMKQQMAMISLPADQDRSRFYSKD